MKEESMEAKDVISLVLAIVVAVCATRYWETE